VGSGRAGQREAEMVVLSAQVYDLLAVKSLENLCAIDR
jgi:hypothetical protein